MASYKNKYSAQVFLCIKNTKMTHNTHFLFTCVVRLNLKHCVSNTNIFKYDSNFLFDMNRKLCTLHRESSSLHIHVSCFYFIYEILCRLRNILSFPGSNQLSFCRACPNGKLGLTSYQYLETLIVCLALFRMF